MNIACAQKFLQRVLSSFECFYPIDRFLGLNCNRQQCHRRRLKCTLTSLEYSSTIRERQKNKQFRTNILTTTTTTTVVVVEVVYIAVVEAIDRLLVVDAPHSIADRNVDQRAGDVLRRREIQRSDAIHTTNL
jgi:hypothetical protein